MANTFDWIEIHTHDVQRAAEFYEALFGWKVMEQEDAAGTAVWIFDTGGEPRSQNLRRGGIWLRPDEPTRIVVYVVVEGIEAILDRAARLGGSAASPKIPVGAGWAASIMDPDGNMVGLYQEKPAD